MHLPLDSLYNSPGRGSKVPLFGEVLLLAIPRVLVMVMGAVLKTLLEHIKKNKTSQFRL